MDDIVKPSTKDGKPTESGLILVSAKSSVALCSAYGTMLETANVLCNSMKDSSQIETMIFSVVEAYVVCHPDSPAVEKFKLRMKELMTDKQ